MELVYHLEVILDIILKFLFALNKSDLYICLGYCQYSLVHRSNITRSWISLGSFTDIYSDNAVNVDERKIEREMERNI